MEMEKIAKQMISFQKTIFENGFTAACVVQDQGEKMVKGFVNQLPWIPGDSKKIINETMVFTRKARDEFKKTVDDNYAKLDEYFA